MSINTRELKKNKFLEFLKSFTLYQIIYLVSVVALVAIFSIFLPDEMLEDTSNTFIVVCSVIAVLANPVCELMISKQSKWNFVVSIIFIEVTEAIVYFSLGWYASAFISILFWIPIDTISFINWDKHKDENNEVLTKVKKLTIVQDFMIVAAIVAFGFGVGYILSLIPGAEDSYLEAIWSAVGMANGLLLLFRYNEQWFAWIIYLAIEAILYIMSGSYIMLITTAAMTVNTIYGFVKWILYIKSRNKEANKKV